MNRADLAEKVLGIKREEGWTWSTSASRSGVCRRCRSPACCWGGLTKPLAAKAAELFGLSKTQQAMLNERPHGGTPMPPRNRRAP